jgi:hypothetical protein
VKRPVPKCMVCGRPCERWERNQDGTYIHTVCAMNQGHWPKGKTGGA